jgi:deoxyribodipyrimidine photo-lyase
METIEKQRIHKLNDYDFTKGNYVLYWMHLSQRVQYNHSLVYAAYLADTLKLPLLVFFGLTDNYPEANLRHYKFMLEGLAETSRELEKRNIKMIVWIIDPVQGVVSLSADAAAVVTDFGYIKLSKKWIFRAAQGIKTKFESVESNIIVPVETASIKEEYAAATFRPKMMKLINLYLSKLKDVKVSRSSLDFKLKGVDLNCTDQILRELKIDNSVSPVNWIKGGTSKAVKRLNDFIKNKLDEYPVKRNYPSSDFSSHMSPYLHFGQISPVYIALKVLGTESPGRDVFLEELIIRRELSFNFVYYNKEYDNINLLPNWAMESLSKHEADHREFLYTKTELEKSQTHDMYWNAAQSELVSTGKMHNYMRMYWGKKIIEWTDGPDTAYEYMVYLNNKYALDGRDPNSYAGIAWCLGKHDRPWGERAIFGKIRYMNDKGLERKFDMIPYVKKYSASGEK